MADSNPDIPPMKEYKSAQYEFNDEQAREIAGLADAMKVVAGLMQLLGFAFLVLCGLSVFESRQIRVSGGYGPPLGLGSAALLCLCIGFWTGGSANSFRKIVQTKNEDVWHLMNALGQLHNMFGLLRTIVLGSLVLAVIATVLVAAALSGK